MSIPSSVVEQIKSSADIVEVVGWYLNLKKSGVNYWACCPFHNEKSPSFSVSASKQLYKCFGCGESGNAVGFVMKQDGKTYPEALRFLAEKYRISIPENTVDDPLQLQADAQRESMLILLQYAQKYFSEVLFNDSEGLSIAMPYFKERGFLAATIQEFGLGYAKDEWQGLQNEALQKHYSLELLEKTGLVIKKEQKTYDRFRGRVIFPIYNLSGRVVAFGARALKKDEKPKYLNSPETEVYSKSKVLYGLFQAKNHIRKQNNCYLTEGYTDVISLWQAGIKNAVASAGTSLTEEHVQLIKRFSENVTLLFDGDAAGIRASLRGVDMLLEQGLNVFAVVLPEGEDPDSYIRKHGATAIQDQLKQSVTNFIKFKTNTLLQDSENDPLKRADALKSIIYSISRITDPIKRAVFCKETAASFEIDEPIIVAECNKILLKERKDFVEKQKNTVVESEPNLSSEPSDALDVAQTHTQNNTNDSESLMVQLLLKYGHLIQKDTPIFAYILEECEGVELSNPVFNKIVMLYKSFIENGESPKPSLFLQHEDQAIAKVAATLLFSYNMGEKWKLKNNVTDNPEHDIYLEDFIYKSLVLLKMRYYQKQETDHLQELKQQTDPNEVRFHLMIHQEIKKQIAHLASLYGNVMY
ncbi:MAG: DNA primase [Cytophagales bacterium]|nr:MAG: DNA primase [Cytophagales bacterium]TAF61693.1 MAG: DNA primase [Cytophagales bacterium]